MQVECSALVTDESLGRELWGGGKRSENCPCIKKVEVGGGSETIQRHYVDGSSRGLKIGPMQPVFIITFIMTGKKKR